MSEENQTTRPQGDTDPQETREWLDSLEYVLQQHGVERSTYLFERLRDRLGERGAPVSEPFNTPTSIRSPPLDNRFIQATSKSSGGSAV